MYIFQLFNRFSKDNIELLSFVKQNTGLLGGDAILEKSRDEKNATMWF